jgi:hypothetical protein
MKILAAFVLICALPTPNLCVPAIQNGTDVVTYPFPFHGDSEEDSDREDPQRMTNINHCLDGYNIFYGNPTPILQNMDPGFRRQIFKAEFEKLRVTGDQRWLQPDGVEIRDCSGNCRIDFKTTEISGAKSYQKSLSNKVSAKVGGSFAGFGASFSASTDFSDAQEKTSKEGKVITQSTATCCSYEARILQFNPPQLTEDFQTAIERLPETFNNRYFDFIDYFGTHYIDRAEYGALYGVQEEITRKDWTTMKEKGLSVAVGASAEAYGVSVSSEYKNEKKTKDSEEFKKHATNRRTFSIGEIPPKSGDVMDWVQKAKSSPSPMRLKLGQISNILGNPSIKFRVPVSSAIKENLEKALKEYCTKWLIKTARLKYPNFSCSEPEDKGFPVVSGQYSKAVVACINGHNDATLSSISLEECKQRCFSSTDFECNSLEYLNTPNKWNKKYCYLSKETKATQPSNYKEPCGNSNYATLIYLENKRPNLTSEKKHLQLTRYGELCTNPCAKNGEDYLWCTTEPDIRGGWDYCSTNNMVTRYSQACKEPCSKDGENYNWCWEKIPYSAGGWDYCSPSDSTV